MAPFFSIGLTTYNRRELLKQALASVLAQSFTDFEVLIGNDYVQETISYDDLGVRDPRVRIVNHPVNLQERGNANTLLALSCGRYFSLLADDDVYAPAFLETLHDLLTINDHPAVAFTSYRIFRELSFPEFPAEVGSRSGVLTGREFLNAYFAGKVKVIGPYGAMDTQWIRSIGGFERMCDGPVELFGEYMLLVRMSALPHIAYTDAQLVWYRLHEGAWTGSNLDLDKYVIASGSLIRKSIPLFLSEALKPDFRAHMRGLLKLTAETYMDKIAAAKGCMTRHDLRTYVKAVAGEMSELHVPVMSRAVLRLSLESILSKGLAEKNRLSGMRAYSRGDMRTVRRRLLYAVMYGPQLLRSRHFLSVLLQSVIGRRTVRGPRDFLKKLTGSGRRLN